MIIFLDWFFKTSYVIQLHCVVSVCGETVKFELVVVLESTVGSAL